MINLSDNDAIDKIYDVTADLEWSFGGELFVQYDGAKVQLWCRKGSQGMFKVVDSVPPQVMLFWLHGYSYCLRTPGRVSHRPGGFLTASIFVVAGWVIVLLIVLGWF